MMFSGLQLISSCSSVVHCVIYSDSNREAILRLGGCELLIDELSRCTDNTAEDMKSDRIKCIVCGCILNVANDNGLH